MPISCIKTYLPNDLILYSYELTTDFPTESLAKAVVGPNWKFPNLTIQNLKVPEQYRRQGHARRLLEKIIEDRGHEDLNLTCRTLNPNKNLYMELGFVQMGPPSYYGNLEFLRPGK